MKKYYKNIFFNSEKEAIDTIKALEDIYNKCKFVTVADICNLLSIPCDSETSTWGWYNVNGFYYTSNDERQEWELIMPEPVCRKVVNEPDMVSHPPHYQSETGIEVIDVIEAFTFDLYGIEAFDVGNIIKYICRFKKKNGLKDLKKAMWYLKHLIDHIEKLEEENKNLKEGK